MRNLVRDSEKEVKMKKAHKINLKTIGSPGDEDGQVAYLELQNFVSKPGSVEKTIRLKDILDYPGEPDIYLDFDKENRLMGIEVI